MSTRNLLGDATDALVRLLALDAGALPTHPEELRWVLREAATEARKSWERDAAATTDHDRGTRCRRWARAVEASWDLARHELDVASGLRRAGEAAA